jgi:uncharacterized protein (DUF1800 family)
MADKDIALMAHLLRRAGFGANRDQIEAKLGQGYEQTVEELLHPEDQPGVEEDVMYRYDLGKLKASGRPDNQVEWVYRMINNPRQLQEKMALFWHMIFCSGFSKSSHELLCKIQVAMFREHGMGNYRDLLVRLAKDPNMIYYLDNNENHKDAVNENWGRELIELFSMGVGKDGEYNYTEEDVRACSRAFTGWGIAPTLTSYPYNRRAWQFRFDPTDHDEEEKTFLGHTGQFNGEDIIDIICKQPATARFISRHVYNFFVGDEAPVPAWRQTPPRDPEAIAMLEKVYFESGYDITAMLRALLNSEFFKEARFTKVKSPVEVVVGTMRLVGDHTEPKPGLFPIAMAANYMGMAVMNPPSVEGWHTGGDWVDSGALVERINFVSDMLGNTALPGVRSIIQRLMGMGKSLSPEQLVAGCLDLVGPLHVVDNTRNQLLENARRGGELRHGTEVERAQFAKRVGETLQLIGSTAEYQWC